MTFGDGAFHSVSDDVFELSRFTEIGRWFNVDFSGRAPTAAHRALRRRRVHRSRWMDRDASGAL